MSDSEHSTVTYTEVSSEFEDLSDIGSPRVIVYGYNGLPMMPENPYAYVEAAMQEPPPLDFVLEPVYPEFMPSEDDEEDDKDPEEDPADYPNDRDDDEEEEESLGDDANDEEEDEEEEHLAPADSVPPPQTGTRGAWMIVRPQLLMAASTEAMIAAIATTLPLPSPLTSYSSPLP
ncbi:hypothetical protein Tco_0975495 [Tanacetum coccineum]|uniref:Uncharacterized protein n=1 Tax=Tanacetum coccineum TaxID=301880 RepID=A0ABQ5EEH6_9ASTR